MKLFLPGREKNSCRVARSWLRSETLHFKNLGRRCWSIREGGTPGSWTHNQQPSIGRRWWGIKGRVVRYDPLHSWTQQRTVLIIRSVVDGEKVHCSIHVLLTGPVLSIFFFIFAGNLGYMTRKLENDPWTRLVQERVKRELGYVIN